MIAIIGLGNPGKTYEKTVHNLGFMALDYFAEKHNLTFSKNKYSGKVAEGVIGGEKVILLKPETFMNLSGKSVEEMVHMLKLNLSQIMVLSDDIDLPFGDLRLRSKGSAGTHNGLRDIVGRIGTDFPRIRIGAGRPEKMDLATFVLSKIPQQKLEDLQSKFEVVSKVIEKFIERKTVEGIDITRF
ncbi:MAG: aminoacyl-tRNA hydrolase [Clostridia bacterium]|nr:aminoacyl-tRNA hydrolase [Clostridia bacterium]